MATRASALGKRKNEELEEISLGGEEEPEGAAAAAAAPADAEAVASQLRISDEHFAHGPQYGSSPAAMSLVDAFSSVQQLCLEHAQRLNPLTGDSAQGLACCESSAGSTAA